MSLKFHNKFLFHYLLVFLFIKENAGKSWWFRNISLYLQLKILKAENMDLTHNIIEYVNCCVGAFANRFKLSLADSYAYLRRFKGIDFLVDCYAAEHTLSIEDAVEDMAVLCQKNDGRSGRCKDLFEKRRLESYRST